MKVRYLPAFVATIMRRGRLRHSGHDFENERRQLLSGIHGIKLPHVAPNKWLEVKSAFLRALISEVAFLKGSLKSEGRHLTTSDETLAYIRIPKAASSALCTAILKERYSTLKTKALTPQQVNALADIHLQNKIKEKARTEFFTVVRNPFERVVSVYRDFFENCRDTFVYEDYLMGVLDRRCSFREFVDMLRVIPDTLKDQHFKPQNLLLQYYDRNRLQVKTFRLEDRDAVDSYLMAQGLKLEEVNRSGEYDHAGYYDHETLEIVRGVYEQDLQRFGYGQAYEDLKFIIEQRHVRY